MSSFNLTRLVTFTPFYMLTNNTSYELEVGEILHEDGPSRIRWHYAGSKEVRRAISSALNYLINHLYYSCGVHFFNSLLPVRCYMTLL